MTEEEKRAAITAHHNKLAGQLVAQIVKGVHELDGTAGDCLVLVESVLVGVFLAVVPDGHDAAQAQAVFNRAAVRLEELRHKRRQLAAQKPQGHG